MPVLDGNFEAFVTNLGKYNEGMLVGEWVKLPTTEEDMLPSEHLHGTHRIFTASQNGKCHLMNSPLPREK